MRNSIKLTQKYEDTKYNYCQLPVLEQNRNFLINQKFINNNTKGMPIEVQTQTEANDRFLYVCILCKSEFVNLDLLFAHLILVKHNLSSGKITCSRCYKILSRSDIHSCLQFRVHLLREIRNINVDASLYTCLICSNDEKMSKKSRRFESPLHLSVHIMGRHNLYTNENKCGFCGYLLSDRKTMLPSVRKSICEEDKLEIHLDHVHYREFELSLILARLRSSRQSSAVPIFSCPLCEITSQHSTKFRDFRSGHSLQAHILSQHCNSIHGDCLLRNMCHICTYKVQSGISNLSDDCGSECYQMHNFEFREMRNLAECNGIIPKSLGNCWATICPICWKRFDVANIHKSRRIAPNIVKPLTAETRLQIHIYIEHGTTSLSLMRLIVSAGSDLNKVLQALLFCQLCKKKIPGNLPDLLDKKDEKSCVSFSQLINEAFNLRLRHLNKHSREILAKTNLPLFSTSF